MAWLRLWSCSRLDSLPERREDGSPILLLDQDRAWWDPVHIMRGLATLDRAEALATELGPYALQAAIAACHARAETARGHRLGAHC